MALIKRRIFGDLLQVGRSITRTFATSSTTHSSSSQQQQESYVETCEDHGVRRILLNHPKTRNSLSLEMMGALLRGLATDSENQSLRSIVISAAPGKIFSAGHNLKELKSSDGEDYHRSVFETAALLMKAISDSPVPVIAAVDGLAAAAGCQLVAACDIVVCTERSSFSTPGANFGIFCSTPGIPLVRNVPRKVAAHMLFTGLPISAIEALRAGLVSKLVANDALDKEIEKITKAINEKSRSVVRLGKRFIQQQQEIDIDTAYSLGTEIMVNNLKLKDAQEGIQSFSEKRKPEWGHNYEKAKDKENDEFISEKTLDVVKDIISMIRQHVREEGLFRSSGRRILREHILDSLRKGERLQIANTPDAAKECAAALHLFLMQMKSPLIPRRVQQLLLADNPGIEAQVVAEDALGLIRQDVFGRQIELLRHLFELLKQLIINAPSSQRADIRSPPLAVIFMPVFFNLSMVDILKWRQIATRLNELIIEAPDQLNQPIKRSDAICNRVAHHNDDTDLIARMTLYQPLARLVENRNIDRVNEATRHYERQLRRPLAGRLHPAMLRVRG